MAIMHLCTSERDLSGLLYENTFDAGSYTNTYRSASTNLLHFMHACSIRST